MKKNFIPALFFFCIFFVSNSLSDIAKKIIVTGNQRIQTQTILEYGNIIINKNYSLDDLNTIQKKIYATGFFDKVSLSLIDDNLNIEVIENPLVNFFIIQGETNSDILNKIYDSLSLGPSKIYSEFKLKNDINFINNYYSSKGYLNTEISPKVVKIDNNQVNISLSVNKDKQFKINRIYFIGNKIFSSQELKDIILSSEDGWWKFLSSSTLANLDRINYDKESLKKYYLNNGYYDVQITSSEIKQLKNQKIDIIFSINSGEFYNFGKFEISDGKNLVNTKIINYSEILKKKYLSNEYSKHRLKLFYDDLSTFIGKNQLDFVNISIDEYKNKNNIDIKLKFISNKKIYINKINVSGNSITEEEVIRRDLKFSEGDSYSQQKINKSLDELRIKNIFKDVKINQDVLANGNVDINIEVKEQPTGSISAGAGYGGEGATIAFGISEINFLGKGIGLNTKISLGSQKIEGYIGSTVPDFLSSDRTLFSNFYSTRTDFTNTLYQSNKTGLDLSTKYELYDDIFFRPGLGLDYEHINVSSSASNYLRSLDGYFGSQRINYNIEKDLRNSKVNTRSGTLLGLTQELATFSSTIPFVKNTLYGSSFIPITEKQTVNIKYGYSNIESFNNDNVKLSDRLFIPYQYTKGFEPRGYGPKDSGSGEFIGGNNSIYGLVSSTVPNPVQDAWNLNTIAFFNAFNVWGTDHSGSTDSNKLRSSFGIGLDWRSPLGPLNLSIAQPISKETTDKTKTFSVEIGTIF